MRDIKLPKVGEISMDQRVKYNNSIGGFLSQKRSLRLSDKEHEALQERKRKIREELRLRPRYL